MIQSGVFLLLSGAREQKLLMSDARSVKSPWTEHCTRCTQKLSHNMSACSDVSPVYKQLPVRPAVENGRLVSLAMNQWSRGEAVSTSGRSSYLKPGRVANLLCDSWRGGASFSDPSLVLKQ